MKAPRIAAIPLFCFLGLAFNVNIAREASFLLSHGQTARLLLANGFSAQAANT